MTAEQQIRAKALELALTVHPNIGLDRLADLVGLAEDVESLSRLIAHGDPDKPWSGTPDQS